eukprot:Hpha_TRINITY_DN15243_c1_g1::TRINITY_DN15243_c1_g1_i2::g.65944::m.65944
MLLLLLFCAVAGRGGKACRAESVDPEQVSTAAWTPDEVAPWASATTGYRACHHPQPNSLSADRHDNDTSPNAAQERPWLRDEEKLTRYDEILDRAKAFVRPRSFHCYVRQTVALPANSGRLLAAAYVSEPTTDGVRIDRDEVRIDRGTRLFRLKLLFFVCNQLCSLNANST